jgi:ElaB/YqjD/DUF883 family membrane-anchored ribosome-binding protein
MSTVDTSVQNVLTVALASWKQSANPSKDMYENVKSCMDESLEGTRERTRKFTSISEQVKMSTTKILPLNFGIT